MDYKNYNTKVDIICNKHGVFKQTPKGHLMGQGCPKCRQSHLERDIDAYLTCLGIDFVYQANKKCLNWLSNQTLDFYLPKYNAAIECQGEQHFKETSFCGKKDNNTNNNLLTIQKRDITKLNKCIKNNLRLFYYADYNIDKYMGNKIYKNKEELIQEIIKLKQN